MENSEKLLKEHAEAFEKFASLLSEYNQKFNLTAITKPQEVEIKHFLDSLAGERYFPQGAAVAEVGSGAGFPSVPLMIARGDLRFTLIESTGKKCEFLRTVIRELNLNGEVVNLRAEDAGRDVRFREKFDVCCARAVARLNTLSEYCLPLVRVGGIFLAYKGETDETAEAQHAISVLGGGETDVQKYELPSDMGRRMLVCIPKKRATPPQYPRGQGRERTKPL